MNSMPIKGYTDDDMFKVLVVTVCLLKISVHYQKLETLPILIFNTITLEKINMDITVFSPPFAKLLKSLTI